MLTPNQTISSPDHRKSSAKYWKDKFHQSQLLIRELNEKSLSLEDIPGLLTIEKVKSKMSKETTRVTQVHGSMHGQDILKLVKEIKEKKDSKKLAVEEKAKQKVWQGKRTETLSVARVLKRFLVDEDGPVDSILMYSLKPKSGSGIT
jgi:hypothetical protein